MACDHISPIKCALRFKPPLLAIVYKDLKTDKTRRRTIPLRGFTKVNDVIAYGDKLVRNPKHGDYVSRLPRQQLYSLLQRIKDCNKTKIPTSSDHTPIPSPTHASLADLPTLSTGQRPTLNQEFEAALDELLGPEDNENILDVTLTPSAPKPSVTGSKLGKSSHQLPTSSPLGELPPLSKLPPLNNPLTGATNTSSVKQQDDQLEKLLAGAVGDPSETSEVPDYSADFNSESEKSAVNSQPTAPQSATAGEEKSLSFAIEELLNDDDNSLILSDEGENFAVANHLLDSLGGDDFRLMDIVTPPSQTNGLPSTSGKEEDLNKADDDYLAQRKAEMETVFLANRSKPGDQDYVYDKEVDFNEGKMESGWDSDDDTMSDF